MAAMKRLLIALLALAMSGCGATFAAAFALSRTPETSRAWQRTETPVVVVESLDARWTDAPIVECRSRIQVAVLERRIERTVAWNPFFPFIGILPGFAIDFGLSVVSFAAAPDNARPLYYAAGTAFAASLVIGVLDAWWFASPPETSRVLETKTATRERIDASCAGTRATAESSDGARFPLSVSAAGAVGGLDDFLGMHPETVLLFELGPLATRLRVRPEARCAFLMPHVDGLSASARSSVLSTCVAPPPPMPPPPPPMWLPPR